MSYGQVQPIIRQDTQKDCIFPAELVRGASERFIGIIRPTPEKLSQRGQGFLAYGEIGWSDAFPRDNQDKTDRVPIMNLTPPEIYKQTGTALVVRAYTNLERFRPFCDVAVGSNRWLKTCFFTASGIRVLPVKGTLAHRSECKPVPAGVRALKGLAKKGYSKFDPEAFGEVLTRYNQPQGCLPSHVMSSRKDTSLHCRR